MLTKYQNIKSGSRVSCLTELTRLAASKCRGWIMKNEVEIGWGSPASPYVPVSKPRAIYGVNVSRVTAHPILFVTRICVWGRSGSFASCRLALSRAEGMKVRV